MDVRWSPSGSRRVRTGAGCSGCLALPFSLALTCGITGAVFGGIELSRQGSDAAAVAAFASCPAVTAALGAPVQESAMAMGCGQSEGGGGSGQASWSLSLRGSRASGKGWYSAHYVGNGPWIVDSAQVTLADGRTVHAVPCASDRSDPPGPDRPDRDGPDRDGPDRGGPDRDRERPGGDGPGGGKAGKRR